MTIKKPKKDEIITLEGTVNDLTATLIQVDTHNIAVLGDKVNRVRGLELSLGDTVKITYMNGILQTIDLVTKKPKEMHIDKSEKTPEETLPEPVTSEGSEIPKHIRLPEESKADVHIQKCRTCGGNMRVVVGIGSGMSLTQCISCKMIDTDPQMV